MGGIKMGRMFGYARVSSREQNLDRQIQALKKYVDEEHILTDKESGKNLNRPSYQALKGALGLRSGDILVITSLDRLSRNKADIKQELQWFKEQNVRLKILDLPTSMVEVNEGQEWILEMIQNILIEVLTSIAEQERITIKNRQREGIDAAKKKGKVFGRPKISRPDEFDEIYRLWKKGEITAVAAMKKLDLSSSTFYRMVKQHESESQHIQNMLKKTKAQMTLNLPGMREENADALRELLTKVQEAERYGRIYSIKQALTDFEDAPYGYTELDVEYLIATLYKKGQIALKMNSVIYSPASTNPDDAYKYITKKEYREKISLAMKEIPKTQWIKSVKTVITDFLGRTVVTDDTDVLMRDFRGYAQTKKASMQILLREEYQKNEKLPGKKLLEKSVRLIDDVLQINDPMTFYKRVDELYGDFDEAAEGLTELTAFLEGAQKDKFNKACFVLSIFKKSENYISDADVIGYAKQVERLINLPEPYNFINKLEEFAIRLQNAITELLEKDAKRIEPDVYADRKIAMEAVLEDRPYADIVSKKINQKFEALLDKLKRTNDIAALNGIPSESNALLENCLADIKNEEAAYQRAQVQQQPSGDKTKEQPDSTVMYLAGFCDWFENERRFVILTTAANESMKKVHDRMPLILEKEQLRDWFSNDKMGAILHQKSVMLKRQVEYEQQSLFW